jgi:TonB-linked SusC/RagA family outer membrane protein
MLMKKINTLLFSLLIVLSHALAQDIQVSGTVTHSADGKPIAGATILVKGTLNGTMTDGMGNYKISCPANTTLIYSFVGMKTTDEQVNGRTTINIVLIDDALNLNQVVVTALGVKREKKQLGYSVQDVKSEDLNMAQNLNPLGALSGKVAGASITQSSGDPGAATYVLLRGQTTIGLSNQPLYVVDGIPIDNSSTSVGNPDDAQNTELENTGSSNRGLDLNPNDIENISVLKGPAAAALYGNQAASGAIIITTKKGKATKGTGRLFNVSYTTNYSWDMVNRLPQLQDQWTKGFAGESSPYSSGENLSWGPKADTLYWNGTKNVFDSHGEIIGASSKNGKSIAFTPYNNVGDFFQTGQTFNNSLAIDGASNFYTYRFSMGNVKQSGIIPLTSLNKTNLSFNSDFNVTDKFTIGASANYANFVNRRAQMGSNLSGLMLGLLRTPISFDNSGGYDDPVNTPEAYMFDDGTQRTYRGIGVNGRGYYDNPFWTINKNKYLSNTNHVIGNMHSTYKINSWITVSERIGTDLYFTNSETSYEINSAANKSGKVSFANESNQILNNDLMVTATKDITNAISTSYMVGWNLYQNKSYYDYIEGQNLTIPGFYHISNAQNIQAKQGVKSIYRKNGLYGQARASYKNYLFADFTARYEQSSTFLPKSLGNFFYPSISTSFVFTDAINYFKENRKILSFGKIRASYASVGKDPSAQSTVTTYGTTTVSDGWTPGEPFPFGGITGFQHGGFTGLLLTPDLKPERTTSREIGVDLRFLNGRIGFDYTYYKSISKDLLLQIPISRSSGYSYIYTNAGKLWSEGHELTLSIVPIKTKDIKWESNFNWSTNVTYCPELAEGIDRVLLNGFEGSAVVVAAGYRFGVFEGGKFMRDANGNVVIDDDKTSATYGMPFEDGKISIISNMAPKWTGGWLNSITYKNFNFSFLIDTKQGGKIWNGTKGALTYFGTAKATEDRYTTTTFNEGIYANSVKGHLDANGDLSHFTEAGTEVNGVGGTNDIKTNLNEDWYLGNGGGFGSVAEHFVEDASYWKLKEMALNYTVHDKFLAKTKFIKGASVGLFGRNLYLNTKYSGVDPETSLTGASDAQGLDYFNNPSTRTFGFNLRINF